MTRRGPPTAVALSRALTVCHAAEDPSKLTVAKLKEELGKRGLNRSGLKSALVERLTDARKRGADIVAEILGYRMNSDGTDYDLPNPERQEECIRQAIENAGIDVNSVDLVSSHATSTPQGDEQECKALRNVFGEETGTLVNNTKSFIGHSMGAAGALELAGNLPAFEDGYAHATINVDDPEPAVDMSLIPTTMVKQEVHAALSNSFGFGGHNSSVIFGKVGLGRH